jgi:nucleoside-diphosphate-sugar epimerase
MNKQISILGIGWLGFPLAEFFIKKRYLVNGSTTNKAKIFELQSKNITPFVIALEEEKVLGNIEEFLANSEILIINIPPKLRQNPTENFVQKIQNLLPYIENSTVKKVVFVSATSVYEDTFPINTYTEQNTPNATTINGTQLYQAEQLLQNSAYFATTIVRFGGLIGNDRNPIKMLAGKTHVANPEAPVNLITQEACIETIYQIIHKNLFPEVYNAVSINNISRKEYYTQQAENYGLVAPTFIENENSIGKKIDNGKWKKII